MAVHAIDREHMIVIADRLQIDNPGRVAEHAQRGRGEQGAFHAVGGAVVKHAAGRAAGVLLMVGKVAIQEALDFPGGIEAPKNRQLGGSKERPVH